MTTTTSTRVIDAPTFEELGVPADIVGTLKGRGLVAPFPIQTLTVADGCAGHDLTGRAPTGSGKTIAFGIPLVTRTSRAKPKRPTGLVLVPTRELAKQVCEELTWLGSSRKLRVAAVYGGAGFGPQLKALRKGVDVLVACPGRLKDLIERREADLGAVEIVVLDEADRMADMGFLPAVRELLDQTPRTRQTLLFSATLDGAVDTVVRNYQRDPIRHVLPEDESAKLLSRHLWWRVERDERIQVCADVVKLAGSSIVFCKTKHGSDAVAKKLGRLGVRAQVIHGNRSQSQRERALDDFAAGKVDTLIATDVVARGIHVDDIGCIVNFDLPHDQKDYVHRAGRTARAGASGVIVTFVGHEHAKAAKGLQRALGQHAALESPTRAQLASIIPSAAAHVAEPEPVHTRDRTNDWTPARKVERTPARKAERTATPPTDGTPEQGTIKWFDARRGFGFIERPGDDDLFVHSNAIQASKNRRIAEGQPVRYLVGPGRRGPEAREVELVSA
ncbi:MAG: DEAD/DEAH box helicase [Acidimicrobiia bacterium]